MTAIAPNPAKCLSLPSLEDLRKDASARLARLHSRDPGARLTEAQRAVAQAYGFRSWRALKAIVARQAAEDIRACAGYYRDDPTLVANVFLAVRVEGGRLLLQSLSGAVMTLQRQADGGFVAPGLCARYGFEHDADGAVVAMAVDVEGRHSRLQRISESEADAIRAAHRLALEDQARPRAAVAVPPQRLARHVGHYAGGHGLFVEITLEDGRLFGRLPGLQALPLDAEGESDFFFAGMKALLRFPAGPHRSRTMTLHHNGAVTVLARVSAEDMAAAATARRFAEQLRPRAVVTPPTALLPRYAGRYRIDGARELVVEVRDDRLFAQITGQARYEIYAEAQNRFFWTVVPAQISFVIGSGGTVSHAVLHQGGRDMPLTRLLDMQSATGRNGKARTIWHGVGQ